MIEQGSLALLNTPIAQQLLHARLPVRVGYVARDGLPRVVPTWFHWDGTDVVMATFLTAPHIKRPAARVAALRQRPAVAMTIDTDTFPPHVLQLRGDAVVSEVDGIDTAYASAARRYLGDDNAAAYLASIDTPTTKMARIAVTPTWVGILDFETRLPSGMISSEERTND
jgi:hypothetical protein